MEIFKFRVLTVILFFSNFFAIAQVALENEVHITDLGLHFNGIKVANTSSDNGSTTSYDFVFGAQYLCSWRLYKNLWRLRFYDMVSWREN